MNFQNLKSIESPDFYLDIAFRKAKTIADERRGNIKLRSVDDKIKKSKELEILKIDIIQQTLVNYMYGILKAYPSLDNLDPFYNELIKCTLDYRQLKKSLGALNWCQKRIQSLFKFYKNQIKKTKSVTKINEERKEYYGRVSSVIKQIKKELAYLEEARKIMKRYPHIKTKMFTVALFGFPNAGKSTLLSRLTTSDPEINSYPFTTKALNVGYIEKAYKKIQVIDTPGTLNRLDKMNDIEMQAYLAIKYTADVIVFVFDLTEEYSVREQKKLLLRIKPIDKPIILYLSKTDIIDEEKIKEFTKNKEALTSIEELKKELMKRYPKEVHQ